MRSLVLTGAVVWLYCCWAADGFSFRYRQRQRSLRSTTSFLDSSRFGIVRLATKAPSDVDEPPKTQQLVTPDILKPFHPASDHMWMCRGPVGQEGFVLNRENGPVSEELTNENILKIVKIECSDLEVNTLVWKCLGYRFNSETEEWSSSECFPNWREMYPTPPDFIGMQRM